MLGGKLHKLVTTFFHALAALTMSQIRCPCWSLRARRCVLVPSNCHGLCRIITKMVDCNAVEQELLTAASFGNQTCLTK